MDRLTLLGDLTGPRAKSSAIWERRRVSCTVLALVLAASVAANVVLMAGFVYVRFAPAADAAADVAHFG